MSRVVSFEKTVAAAGTAVALTTTKVRVMMVFIQVKRGNTGAIYVGDSTVDSTNCIELINPAAANTPDWVQIGHPNNHDPILLDEIFVDAAVNGEGVNVFYVK